METNHRYVFALRAAKSAVLASVSLFCLLIVFGNVTDYWVNFEFVARVLSMDGRIEDLAAASNIDYRAVTAPALHHAAYALIIAVELFVAVACGIGAWRTARAARGDDAAFDAAKTWGIIGLTAGILLWFTGFQAIGGEWFGMWMSEAWNGLPAADRITTFFLGALIFLSLRNDHHIPR
ncbi:putative small integral membrane protein [Nocardiopsis mwathae]|uniref:Putative small integral membrane protein n=1 Tax=Nocardiopsis mwathae TaxID=1472723 RepID=A0A7W9YKA8_9ACTN|nr:DUF2165 domain-containing protein [Nocardiopsis mwathae]MBB6173743.1 putative small integral membrane protein [Nocardiopsis mwathae]